MLRIGFLGGGRMAHAMAKGFISAGLTKGNNIIASCAPQDVQCIDAFEKLGATMTFKNPEVAQKSEVIIVAVKPNIVPVVLKEVHSVVTNLHLLISVAMGVTIKQLEQSLPKGIRVIRAMPNTPALIRTGASVFTRGTDATLDDAELTSKLFEAVGTCDQVPEYMMDTITGLSGSGPAYVYMLIEALADGAVRMGLPRDLAYRLAAQTVVGAGKMVLETKEHPGQLKDNVMSPGGTTAAGVYALEKNSFRLALLEAVEAATNRGKEMGQNLDKK